MKAKISILSFALLALSSCSFGFSAPVNTTEEFLSLIEQNDIEGAYTQTSTLFQQQTNLEKFNEYVDFFNLSEVDSTKWLSRTVTKVTDAEDQAEIRGTFIYNDSKEAPTEVYLVKEDGDWKIYYIKVNNANPIAESQVPSAEELSNMTDEVMIALIEAIRNGNFTSIYENVMSNNYRLTNPQSVLENNFANFVEKQELIPSLESISPTIDDTKLTNDMLLLQVQGRYIHGVGSTLQFSVAYTLEDEQWKVQDLQIAF